MKKLVPNNLKLRVCVTFMGEQEQDSQKKPSKSLRKLLQERIGKADPHRKNLTQEETNRVEN
mgnify:CR=1 FL=1